MRGQREMNEQKDNQQALAEGVARIISDNKKFLLRLMDDEYEPEEETEIDVSDDETPVG